MSHYERSIESKQHMKIPYRSMRLIRDFYFSRIMVYMLRAMHHDYISTCSLKRFTCYSVVDLFNQISSQLLWQVSSQDAIDARSLFVGLCTYPSMSTHRSWMNWSNVEWNTCPSFDTDHLIRTRILLVERSAALTTAPLRHCAATTTIF